MNQYKKTPMSQLIHRCNLDIKKVRKSLVASGEAMGKRHLSGPCVSRNAEALAHLHQLELSLEKVAALALKDEEIAIWFRDNIEDDDT